MAIWAYIGCSIKHIPGEILDDPRKLENYEIKQIIESVPLIEGELMAATEEAVVSLLLYDNIFPLKIHKYNRRDNKINKLKRYREQLYKKSN